jgi:hypothetical protein
MKTFFQILQRFCQASLPVVASLLITTPLPSYCAEPTPGGIEWKLISVEDEAGEWWNAFKIETVPGVRYDIQKSGNLEGTWDTVASYYGGGMEVIHPLFPGTEPDEPPVGSPPVLPAIGHTSRPYAFTIVELTAEGGLVLSWRSFDSGQLIRHALTGPTLDPVWQEFDGWYFNLHGSYMLSISPRFHHPSPTPQSQLPLGTLDQDFVTAFVDALPEITQNIVTSVANAVNATPPPPPDPNSKGFFRIFADWAVDSDGDRRFDWQELNLDGNSPFNADSDGDGIPDNEDLPVFQNAATSGDLERPPVAEFEHRYVAASRWLNVSGLHADISAWAVRSDEFVWPADGPEVFSLLNSDSFGELTAVTAALPLETSLWQPGVVSLDAVNFAEQGEIQTIEWSNFRCEYRLKLPEDAPVGGYEIPLKFAKVFYQWDSETYKWIPAAPPAGQSTSLTVNLSVTEGNRISAPIAIPLLDDVGVNRRVTLVPADIAILEGIGTTPADGLCVQTGETFKLDFNGKEREAYECRLPDEWITWQVRRLMYDGNFESWTNLVDPVSQELVKGCEVTASVPAGHFGCYQVRASVSHDLEYSVEIPAVRMRDATNAINADDVKNPKLAAGQPEYLGVANNNTAESVRNGAVRWLGSTAYSLVKNVETRPGWIYNADTTDANKCNIFVTHVANANTAPTPYWYYKFLPRAPIARDDWYSEPELHIDLDGPGWNYIGTWIPILPVVGPLVPGMVVASHGLGTQGHCGIIDYDGAWINAGLKTVNKSIHATHPNEAYTDYHMRMR